MNLLAHCLLRSCSITVSSNSSCCAKIGPYLLLCKNRLFFCAKVEGLRKKTATRRQKFSGEAMHRSEKCSVMLPKTRLISEHMYEAPRQSDRGISLNPHPWSMYPIPFTPVNCDPDPPPTSFRLTLRVAFRLGPRPH